MITFKCKMCGGDLTFEQGASVAECPYCGTNQTLPKLDDDKRANLYDRANHFRRQNEYDKAMAIYEQILAEDRTDAEAWWSLVLCRYGIEYVEDPASRKRVPTVNRVQYASILADEDYKSALANADAAQRGVYEAEASAIAEIQRGILDISRQEEPFDVFICYKETDANGRRTPDSVLANDMYHQLTKEGFKVFFARITLEDKIGSAYEPYIFAALNSARVMVALGTKPEYFNAVWVKNEWSRYLALIKNGADKTLVPAYRDMDPYDLPEEFAHLQAQDMGKLGFMQDLIRGIKKILHKDEAKPQTVAQPATAAPANDVAPLLERAFMFLEDGDWLSADEYAEKVLDRDPKNGRAYLGKLMAQLKVRRESELKDRPNPFDGDGNYQKILRFGDEALKAQLKDDIDFINDRNEHDRQQDIFNHASVDLQRAVTEAQCLEARQRFQSIPKFEGVQQKLQECDAKVKAIRDECYRKAEAIRDERYRTAKALQESGQWRDAIDIYRSLEYYRDCPGCIEECKEQIRASDYAEAEAYQADGKWKDAINAFNHLGDYRDSRQRAQQCLEAQEKYREQQRIEAERKVKAEAARKKRITLITVAVIMLAIAGILAYIKVIKPNSDYQAALSAMNAGNYDEATEAFKGLGDYKDAATQAQESQYQKGVALLASGDYDGATEVFNAISSYSDAATQAQESQYQKGVALMASGDYDVATEVFNAISSYSDAATQAQESQYQKGVALMASGDYDGATEVFKSISDYSDAATQVQESQYQKAQALYQSGEYDSAYSVYGSILGYRDVDSLLETDDNLIAAAWRAQFEVGNTVTYGQYEQDNDTANGAEPIEWIVLANDGETAMLISRYGLDAVPYNAERTSVTWGTCTLRKWLNGEFLNTAFSEEERAKLETVTVTADANPKYSTDPGSDTQDMIFLLSIDEVNRYFDTDDARVCMPTKTAVANGAHTNSCWWWLRSPGYGSNCAAFVDVDGSVFNLGNNVNNDYEAVRPVVVLWLSQPNL